MLYLQADVVKSVRQGNIRKSRKRLRDSHPRDYDNEETLPIFSSKFSIACIKYKTLNQH